MTFMLNGYPNFISKIVPKNLMKKLVLAGTPPNDPNGAPDGFLILVGAQTNCSGNGDRQLAPMLRS